VERFDTKGQGIERPQGRGEDEPDRESSELCRWVRQCAGKRKNSEGNVPTVGVCSRGLQNELTNIERKLKKRTSKQRNSDQGHFIETMTTGLGRTDDKSVIGRTMVRILENMQEGNYGESGAIL